MFRTLVRLSVEESPLEVMAAPAEGAMVLPPRVHVKEGGGLPLAEHVKFAAPPSGVMTSAGCWVMEGGNG